MKRILAIFLAVLMVFTMLSACGGNTDKGGNDDVDNDADNEASDYRDMYEEEFWAAHLIGTDSFNFFWPEPKTTDKERTRQVATETEQLLNCKLLEEGFSGTGLNNSAWQTRMATGDYTFSWTTAQEATVQVYTFYNAGFIQSWNDIPGVDLSNAEVWGSPRNQANASFNGELYLAGVGEGGGTYGRLFFNKILAVELTSMSPQELYEADNWTWASFEDYLEKCTLTEADRTVYGMSVWATSNAAKAQFPLSAIFSNGGEVVRVSENGTATFSLNEPQALEALDWANKMATSGTVVFDTAWPPDTWAKSMSVFCLGDGAFGTASSGSSAHWGLDNLEDLRCIPFPIGPKGDKTTTSGSYTSTPSGTVLLFGVDKENAGYVWGVKSEVALKYSEDTEEEWKRKTFFQDDPSDDDSYNNFKFGSENYNLDYTTQIGDQTILFQQTLFEIVRGAKTPAAGIQEISGLVTANLNEAFGG